LNFDINSISTGTSDVFCEWKLLNLPSIYLDFCLYYYHAKCRTISSLVTLGALMKCLIKKMTSLFYQLKCLCTVEFYNQLVGSTSFFNIT